VPDQGPPLRAIARITDAWSFDIVHEWFGLFGGDTRMAEVWLFARSANTRHLLEDPVLAERYRRGVVAPADYRPVKIRTIANALGFNFEAVRRKVAMLRAAGVCLFDDRGVIVLLPAGVSALASQTDGLSARLLTLIARLRTLILENGYDDVAITELRAALDHDFGRIVDAGTPGFFTVSRYLASTLLSGAMLFGADRDSAAIYFTIYVVSERALGHDPQRSRADGWIESEPLAGAVEPVSIRNVARQIGLPAESVRRKITRLVDKGQVAQVAGGVVLQRTPDVIPVHARRVYANLLATLAAVRQITPPETSGGTAP